MRRYYVDVGVGVGVVGVMYYYELFGLCCDEFL